MAPRAKGEREEKKRQGLWCKTLLQKKERKESLWPKTKPNLGRAQSGEEDWSWGNAEESFAAKGKGKKVKKGKCKGKWSKNEGKSDSKHGSAQIVKAANSNPNGRGINLPCETLEF